MTICYIYKTYLKDKTMKKLTHLKTCLAGLFILGTLFTSCNFNIPSKKTIPEGDYIKEVACYTTGTYEKTLDGEKTDKSIDVTIRCETFTVSEGNRFHYTYGEYTYYDKEEGKPVFTTRLEPLVDGYKEIDGTYTIYANKKITFAVEGSDTYTFQHGAAFDYVKNGNEISFIKRAYLDGSYILGPFVKQD